MPLLDEVFAVGDEQFSASACRDRLQERRGTIRSSYYAQAVERRAIGAVLLRQGEVAFDGDTRQAIGADPPLLLLMRTLAM